MIAILHAICYRLVELLATPEIKKIRLITRECVSKIMSPARDKDGYPISGQDVATSIIRFSLSNLKKNEESETVTQGIV